VLGQHRRRGTGRRGRNTESQATRRTTVGHYGRVELLHEDQIDLELHVVRHLIDEQFPQWSGLPLQQLSTGGTVNAIFRIGDRLAARFPLRPEPATQVKAWLIAESSASAEFADVSTVRAPRPVALGEPGEGYSMPWAVQTWVPGVDATVHDPGQSTAFAADLAHLILAVQATNVDGRRFGGAGRGGHLPDHDPWMSTCFEYSEGLLDVAELRKIWAALRELPEVDPDVMTHGDLTPANVLIHDGRLAGVLDTGGFAPADPALDLIVAWHLLEPGSRQVFRTALDCPEITWRRGIGWAFVQAMGAAWYYAESHPVMSDWARRTLYRIVAADEHG
jgi:aminoglycoside phosphotransferase (APT) family kinase protein